MDKDSLFYLGPAASFSHICTQQIVERLGEMQLIAQENLRGIVQGLLGGANRYALLPLENSLGGSVPETLGLFLELPAEVKVCLEWVLPIEHQLLSWATALGDLREVRGHYQAFLQCDQFLKRHLPANLRRREFTSNSAAVESLRSLSPEEQRSSAAIGPREAGELYQVPILSERINDRASNYTRFWLLGRGEADSPSVQCSEQILSSFTFRIPLDRPGGLVAVLKPLADKGLNLTKIESRPTKDRLGEYSFWVDVLDTAATFDVEEIRPFCDDFRFLGRYPVLPVGDSRFQRL